MTRRRLLTLLLVGVLVVPGSMVAGAAMVPAFYAQTTDNQVTPGTESTVTVEIINSATVSGGTGGSGSGSSGTARAVQAYLQDDIPGIETESGAVELGTLKDGQKATATFSVSVGEGVETGVHKTDVVVKYEYVSNGVLETKRVKVPVRIVVSDDARFEVKKSTANVSVGETGDLSLKLKNVGAEAASDAVVTVESASGNVQFGASGSTSQYVESWGDGSTETLTFETSVAPSAATQPYPLSVSVSFTNEEGASVTSETLTTSITPESDQEAAIGNGSSSLAPGAKGSITATVTNEGPGTLNEATIALAGANGSLRPAVTSQPIGTVEPGEEVTFTYPVRVTETAESGPRQVEFAIGYDNDEDEPRQLGGLSARFEVLDEQEFALGEVSSTLRVGSEGSFNGTITNEGPNAVSDAVVRLQSSNPNVLPQETEFAVGRLEAGESADFDFPVDISEGTASGPRQLSVVVEYQNDDGERRSSDALHTQVQVAPDRDVFAVEPVNASVAAGDTASVTLRVTNRGDETLRDINAKAFLDDPLSAPSDEAYVQSLDAGESTTVSFEASAGSDAAQRDYPLELDFQYTEPDGDTKLTDTYQVPLRVTEPGENGSPLLISLGVLGVIAVGVGAVLYRRR